MFKSYQWNSEELKKKAAKYYWLALLMALSALIFVLLAESISFSPILLVSCLSVSLIFFWQVAKITKEDKKLTNPKKIEHIDKD